MIGDDESVLLTGDVVVIARERNVCLSQILRSLCSSTDGTNEEEILKRQPDALCETRVDVIEPSRLDKEHLIQRRLFVGYRADEAKSDVVEKKQNHHDKKVEEPNGNTVRSWKGRLCHDCDDGRRGDLGLVKSGATKSHAKAPLQIRSCVSHQFIDLSSSASSTNSFITDPPIPFEYYTNN
jgi:hypothetical protein